MSYRAPINDMLLALNHGAGLQAAVKAGHYGDFDADDHSVMSIGSPATPQSIRSQRSSSVAPLRKEKNISLVEPEDCGLDHPLGFDIDVDQDLDLLVVPVSTSKDGRRRKSSFFKSNLTSSLQALKSRALSSISSLNRAMDETGGSEPAQRDAL